MSQPMSVKEAKEIARQADWSQDDCASNFSLMWKAAGCLALAHDELLTSKDAIIERTIRRVFAIMLTHNEDER